MPFFSSPNATLKLGLVFTTVASLYLLYATLRKPSLGFPLARPGETVHIVLFQYSPSVTASVKHDVSHAFMALKDTCRLPDGSKYILSIDGGLNTSPEEKTKGMEHAFVVTFRTARERDYYLDQDAAHQVFKASIAEKVQDVVVFDFESGQFARERKAAARRHGRRRSSEESHVRSM
ncbi:hypothetical protein EW026_g6968 [Hermanssonia centrifuga]|uniref:Stress-response A/B barrel domain-containing protein n=1 Tax=Hermanssonia centrifuga TaxID=98765 RepID=A0A4S4K9D6_9APHY|nr:hypothetical protein EW026_g6968 [Hermanssonia centrifuga]